MSAGRSRRPVVVTVVCLIAALGAGAATWAVIEQPTSTQAAEEHPSDRATAPVTKGDLVASKTIAGTLGYGAPVGVPGAASGILTWLPDPGQVIHRDEPLYAVDERPVRAMYGAVPLWRDLGYGDEGTDVRQLNENLAALGYDVLQDDVFGKRTLAGVRQWQEDRDLEVTGTVTKDQIAFVDGEVRVASVDGQLGQPTGGDVLRVTSTERVVTATVPQRDADQVAVGTAVQVVVNGVGDPMPGKVSDAAPDDSEDGGQKVAVTVAFDAGDRKLPGAASAQVIAEGQSERDVLSVPVAALVAGSGTGDEQFAVDVVRRGGKTERVPVRVDFVADGRAAVTGDLHEGDRVVVPS